MRTFVLRICILYYKHCVIVYLAAVYDEMCEVHYMLVSVSILCVVLVP